MDRFRRTFEEVFAKSRRVVLDVPSVVCVTTDKPTLLCFGRHEALLASRVAILSRTYLVTPVGSLEELGSLPIGSSFDLILLCHTLGKEDCVSARAIIGGRWPTSKVLSMTKSERSCALDGDSAVRGLDGPGVLLQRLETLMRPVEPGIGVMASLPPAHL